MNHLRILLNCRFLANRSKVGPEILQFWQASGCCFCYQSVNHTLCSKEFVYKKEKKNSLLPFWEEWFGAMQHRLGILSSTSIRTWPWWNEMIRAVNVHIQRRGIKEVINWDWIVGGSKTFEKILGGERDEDLQVW